MPEQIEQPESLLQDITIPPIEDLGESLRLFFSGENLIAKASSPVDPELVDFFKGAGK